MDAPVGAPPGIFSFFFGLALVVLMKKKKASDLAILAPGGGDSFSTAMAETKEGVSLSQSPSLPVVVLSLEGCWKENIWNLFYCRLLGTVLSRVQRKIL